MLLLLACFSNVLAFGFCQSCLKPLNVPIGSDTNSDSSGLRPSKQPPIAIGSTFSYQCPGVKSAFGVSSWIVSCNELGDYVYPSAFSSWPICQCNEDITSKCSGLSYKMGYIDKIGDNGTMSITLPQPSGISSWSIDVQLDINLVNLSPSVDNAQLYMNSGSGFMLKPLPTTDLKAASATIVIKLNFTGTDFQGIIPHWKFPCIASINCNYEVDNPTENHQIWIIIGCAGAGFAIFIIILSVCICCCCKSKDDDNSKQVTRSSSAWSVMEERQFKQQTRAPRAAYSAPPSRRY